MSKPRSTSATPILTAILGPSYDYGRRDTEISIKNFRESHHHTADWYMIETPFGVLNAVRHSREWFEVEIILVTAEFEPHQFLTAVATAFSFVMGKRVHVLGYESHFDETTTRNLSVSMEPSSKRHLLKPFINQLETTQAERCLEMAIAYFLTEDGDTAAGYLHLCWDTVDNDISTMALSSTIATEGLVRLVSRQSQADGSLDASVTMVSQFLEDHKIELGESFVNRVQGCMGSFKSVRPVDSLNKWQSSSLLNVQKEDIKAWSSLRNSLAHASAIGLPADRDKKQHFFRNLQRVQSLNIRIVLQLMGFDGFYTDYNQPHPMPAKFPLVDPSML